MMGAQMDTLRIDVVPNEVGTPSVIWIEHSGRAGQSSRGMMLSLEEVPALLSDLARLTGIAAKEAYQQEGTGESRFADSLQLRLIDEQSADELPDALARDELPLVTVCRAGGSGSCIGIRLHDAAAFQDRLVQACEEFRAWKATSLYNAGTKKLNAGLHDEAIPLLRQAIQVDPGHALAVFNLAMCYDLTGQTQDAWPWYERASELDPSDPDPIYNMAEILFRQRHYDRAESLCRQALSLFEEQFRNAQFMPYAPWGMDVSRDQYLADVALKKATADYLMACIAANQGKLQMALKSAQEAVSICPSKASWWLLVAQLHRDLGNRSEAQRAFARATEMDPDIARRVFGHGSR